MITFKKTVPFAVNPYIEDGGINLYSAEDKEFFLNVPTCIATGIAFDFPANTAGIIKEKSLLAHSGLIVVGGMVCGTGFQSDRVLLVNTGQSLVRVDRGQLIARVYPVFLSMVNLKEFQLEEES